MATKTGANMGFTWGYIAGDSGWGASFNKLAQYADDLIMCGVKDSSTGTPPSSPTDGDRYIVGPSAGGAWAAKEGKLAVWDNAGAAWRFYTPAVGWSVRCAVKGRLDYISTGWVVVLTDAPSDGIARARKDGGWVAVVEEAPNDGQKYVRKNGNWEALP